MTPKLDPGVPEEVGAALQDVLDVENELSPPTHTVPYYLANFRHPCKKARQSAHLAGKGVSTAIDLKERYVVDESGDYALIYREGTCKRCGDTARSAQGRVVLTSERPPVTGRVGRE